MSLEAEAFKALYPHQYFARFFANGTRPDGRSLSRARATVIGFQAVSSADSSALVKIGSTTALCTLTLQVCNPTPYKDGDEGVEVVVEITPLCQQSSIPGRLGDWGKTLARQLERVLHKASPLSEAQLRIPDSVARWGVTLHVTILDADGCVFDAAFLACVCALQSARLPEVEVDNLRKAQRGGRQGESGGVRLELNSMPVSLTLGTLGEALVADPTSEEEAVMEGGVTVVMNEHGDLLGRCLMCA